MDQIVIRNIKDLHEIIDDHPYGEWAFRGQSEEKWKLEPSITRYTSQLTIVKYGHRSLAGSEKLDWSKKMREFELKIFEEYIQSNCSNKNINRDNDLLESLVNLQHYGAPTRLLDFSLKPYIALFFAILDGVGDCSLFTLNLNETNEIKNCDKSLVDIFWGEEGANNPNIYSYRPKYQNERIEMQSGVFIVASTSVLPFEKIINKSNQKIKKYIIPGHLRHDLKIMLNKMNISPKSIYPEEEGIIKSLAWEASTKALA